jgi:hypothetical protein
MSSGGNGTPPRVIRGPRVTFVCGRHGTTFDVIPGCSACALERLVDGLEGVLGVAPPPTGFGSDAIS